MSATVNNASLELLKEDAEALPSSPSSPASPTNGSGHEALQALLAFSALHEEIRIRRSKQSRDGESSSSQDDWTIEQFVLDETLQLVADRALAITGADGVAIALAEGDAIVCRASAGSIAPDAGVRLDPKAGFSGECLVSGSIVRCDDAESDPRVNLQACRGLGVRSMLAVPLSAKQSVVGLLEAFSSEPYGFNDSDVRSLNLLAELILSAMKPEEEDRLREISRRVVPVAATEPKVAEVQSERLVANLGNGAEPASSEKIWIERSELIAEENSKSSDAIAEAESVGLDRSRPGLTVVAVVVLVAVVSGAGVWWTLGHRARLVRASVASVSQAAPQSTQPATASPGPLAAVAPSAVAEADDEKESPPATPEEAGLLPKITGIRHWSSAESSTVVIDLQDQVQYEAHRLPNPERIYFDLHDTTLAAGFTSRTISVNDAMLQRVRVAQPMAGVTRVVLETNGASDFSVSLEPNPYRLVVEVRKAGTNPHARKTVDLFTPANPGLSDQAAIKAIPADAVSGNQKALNRTTLNPISLNQIPLNPIPQSAASATSSKPVYAGEPLAPIQAPKLRVVLDAGHGGWDLGTVGRKGLLEKDLVLDIVERLGRLVQSRLGAEVIYTRKDDSYLALEKRAEIANRAQANLFVSVHANYSDYPSARGVETYYTNTYSSVKARTEQDDAAAGPQTINWTNVDIREKVHESRRVAASVQHALYAMLAADNPGLRNRGVKEAQYVVLTGTSMPAILAEVSFVSSPTDENNLQSSTYRQQIAEALYRGIAHYQGSNRNVKMATAAKPVGR
ncbi:MAG TPA: N-acetylmuramoyl-L-alanine amidase [Terriglobales bacterium]|nr:N-acetylmuramoyl-L-alanine amidase [Terriglobales bacterium]